MSEDDFLPVAPRKRHRESRRKHGATIAAIRNLPNAAAGRHGEKAVLEIVEDQPPGG
jgi:hypothetical protein